MPLNKTKYTIGVLFLNDNLDYVLLILKQRPNWQKGKYNFPGGHVEKNEKCKSCISREFNEKTNLNIKPKEWISIGKIINNSNTRLLLNQYEVNIFTSIYNPNIHGHEYSKTDEIITWCNLNAIPEKHTINNIKFIAEFAKNFYLKQNLDKINFGIFKYIY